MKASRSQIAYFIGAALFALAGILSALNGNYIRMALGLGFGALWLFLGVKKKNS